MQRSGLFYSRLSDFYAILKRSLRGEEIDFTVGSIRSAVILLAIPMILEMMLATAYEIKLNGLEFLLTPIKRSSRNAR